ncbi:MAG: prepilin peptidase [Candidatus Eisenbacteria bacterium]|nr:prepilin peptidase [Candidatus Eisenbacteria bacterium]
MDFVLLFIAGLAIGSFLNVCIHRVPRRISVCFPSSHCPLCKTPIRPMDNIPVFSFLILKGRCRHCGARIRWQYPVVELASGLLLLLSYFKFGFSFELLLYYAFCCALVVITFVDLEFRIIPDTITLPFMVLGLAGSVFSGLGLAQSLLGIIVGGGSLTLVGYVYTKITKVEGMGGGDVKLTAMMGAFLGWKAVLIVIFVASLAGSALGIVLMLMFRMSRRTPIPFGSFLAPVGIVVLLCWSRLVEWYLSNAGIGH